jgi:CHAT domain-containing protein
LTLIGSHAPDLRLVIIPDGPMHGIPFAALRDPAGKYLVERAVVSSAGSATLFVFSLLRDGTFSANSRPTALLFGNPKFDKGLEEARGLSSLPAAGREVATIGALYAGAAQVVVEEDATVSRFLSSAPGSTVIHIAAHAVTNANTPSRSVLLLAPSGNQTGALSAADLLRNARLDQSRLFVLAACSSAGGAPVGAEGLAPLVRPLIAAGVPAVVGSLWDVEDTTAEDLLVRFHQHFRKGLDAAAALRKAQLEALRDRRVGVNAPLVWAPYQVIGYASSPFPTTPNQKQGDPPQ